VFIWCDPIGSVPNQRSGRRGFRSVTNGNAANFIKNSYSTAVKGTQDYNNKIIEFTHANTNAAFDFVQRMSGMKSPSEFLEFWTEHARKQVETLTEQSKQLVALAQKVTRATAEPLKTCVANPFKIAA